MSRLRHQAGHRRALTGKIRNSADLLAKQRDISNSSRPNALHRLVPLVSHPHRHPFLNLSGIPAGTGDSRIYPHASPADGIQPHGSSRFRNLGKRSLSLLGVALAKVLPSPLAWQLVLLVNLRAVARNLCRLIQRVTAWPRSARAPGNSPLCRYGPLSRIGAPGRNITAPPCSMRQAAEPSKAFRIQHFRVWPRHCFNSWRLMKDTATGWTQGGGFFPLSRPTSSPSQPLCRMHTPHAFHSFALSPFVCPQLRLARIGRARKPADPDFENASR